MLSAWEIFIFLDLAKDVEEHFSEGDSFDGTL